MTDQAIDDWHRGNPARRCVAHKKNGERCRRWAIRGGTVCRYHGGAAPQVMAKARETLALASYHNVRNLLGLADDAESEQVRLQATNSALDRAGLSAKQSVELSAKEPAPWEELLADIGGIEKITRQESRARRGLAPDPRALASPDDDMEIVDAEVVEPADDGPADPARSPADRRPPGTPDGDPPPPPQTVYGPPSAPPGTGLMTLEQAAEANRQERLRRRR